MLSHFRHIEITELHSPVLVQKYICTFEITMKNFHFVKIPKSFDNLNENLPDVDLRKFGFLRFVSDYFLVKVSSISILHDDAKRLSIFRKKSFFV